MVFTAGKHTEHTVGGTFDYYSAFFMTTHHIFCFGDKKALTSMIYKTLLDLSAMYVLLNQVATKALMKYERPKKKRYARQKGRGFLQKKTAFSAGIFFLFMFIICRALHSFVSLLKIVTCPFYQNHQKFVRALLQKLKNIPGSAQYTLDSGINVAPGISVAPLS